MRLCLLVLWLGVLGCASPAPVLVVDGVEMQQLEIHEDGSYGYWDGCNWHTCDPYGSCWVTAMACPRTRVFPEPEQ